MNDRFRFRAWNKKEKIMYYDAEKTYDFLFGRPKAIPCDNFEGLLWDEDFVVEQCTGLKDKNGKLIYEDDIVRWSLCRGDKDICENYQIIWQDNCAAFGCLKSNGDILDMFSQPKLKAKVIGNIHENPDLLESEER